MHFYLRPATINWRRGQGSLQKENIPRTTVDLITLQLLKKTKTWKPRHQHRNNKPTIIVSCKLFFESSTIISFGITEYVSL